MLAENARASLSHPRAAARRKGENRSPPSFYRQLRCKRTTAGKLALRRPALQGCEEDSSDVMGGIVHGATPRSLVLSINARSAGEVRHAGEIFSRMADLTGAKPLPARGV